MKKIIVLFSFIFSFSSFAGELFSFKVSDYMGSKSTGYGRLKVIYTDIINDNEASVLDSYYDMSIKKNQIPSSYKCLINFVNKEWKDSSPLKKQYLEIFSRLYNKFLNSNLNAINIYVSEQVKNPFFIVINKTLFLYKAGTFKTYKIYKDLSDSFRVNYLLELKEKDKSNGVGWTNKGSVSPKSEKQNNGDNNFINMEPALRY